MRKHTQEFKEKIKQMGRQLDSKITFGETELGNEQLNAVTPVLQSALLKSVMKELDIDSNVEIPIGTIINYKFGVLLDSGEYEYLDYGNYQVYSCEKQEDTNSYNIVAYDKMLNSMVNYVSLKDETKTFPMTMRDYISAICGDLGLTFANANDEFANYDKVIQADLYANLGYTYRDVLDELAQVTASNIVINKSDELEIRYITDTQDTINEEYLKDINVKFGEKYGKINSIVLSRAAESDNVYLQDEQSIADNGLCELKIVDNQIMNFNDRSDYLPAILEKLDGLEYYINDFSSTGICYYEVADRYNVKVGDNTYSCVMFNDEIDITQGLEEVIHTDLPEQAETDYTKADKTDRKINQTYIIVDKQNQQIESVVSQVDGQNEKISQVTQTVSELNQKIQNISDITISDSTLIAYLELDNINESEPINIIIRPLGEDISYLYPHSKLFPSDNLYLKTRTLRFHNKTTDENIDYILPDDLLYYDADNYDEFRLDYDTQTCEVRKKVAYDEEGNKYLLDDMKVNNYDYPTIRLTDGDYEIRLLGYSNGYLSVRLMASNIYTSQFATRVELKSSITQTEDKIELEVNQVENLLNTEIGNLSSRITQTSTNIMTEVNKKVGNNEIISRINQSAEAIQISANKISLEGKTIALTSDNITISSSNFNVDKNGNLTCSNATANNLSINEGTINLKSSEQGARIKMSDSQNSSYYWEMAVGIWKWNGYKNGFIAFENRLKYPIISLGDSDNNQTLISSIYVNSPSITQTSLVSQKKNFEKFNNALSIINNIDLYKYNLKSEEDNHKKHIGFVIGDNYKYSSEITAVDENGEETGVDLYSMTSLCLQAIKELYEIIKRG